MEFVIRDRYGYLDVISASDPWDAVLKSSNLSSDADVGYVTTSYVGHYEEFTQKMLDDHNKMIADNI